MDDSVLVVNALAMDAATLREHCELRHASLWLISIAGHEAQHNASPELLGHEHEEAD